MKYAVVSPLYGALEVHVEGCSHSARLHANGGGVLADGFESRDAAVSMALDEADGRKPKVAPCVRKVNA